MEETMGYVDEIWTDGRGGCMVDFVALADGKMLTVNENGITFFETMDDLYDGRAKYEAETVIKKEDKSTEYENIKKVWAWELGGGCMVDFLQLVDGRMLCVSADCICLYQDMKAFWDGEAIFNWDTI